MTGVEPAKLIAVIIYELDNALTIEQSSAKFGGPGETRTRNSGVQNRCVPLSTTSPNTAAPIPSKIGRRHYLLLRRAAT